MLPLKYATYFLEKLEMEKCHKLRHFTIIPLACKSNIYCFFGIFISENLWSQYNYRWKLILPVMSIIPENIPHGNFTNIISTYYLKNTYYNTVLSEYTSMCLYFTHQSLKITFIPHYTNVLFNVSVTIHIYSQSLQSVYINWPVTIRSICRIC